MTRISRLRIKNFRSIEEMDMELPQVCALVGPNNAGKSNILEAIRRILAGSWLTVKDFDESDVYLREDRDIEINCTLEPPLQYKKFRDAEPAYVHCLQFKYTKYKTRGKEGERRLEQKCLDAVGEDISVLAKAPRRAEKRVYTPLIGVPSEIRTAVPLIYIGTNRSLSDQLPTARYSLLRRMFEEIDADLHSRDNKITVQMNDGTYKEFLRVDRFRTLISAAMNVLRTDGFIEIENAIKRNALRMLGFDEKSDVDKIDLSFSPMSTFDFYKSLDLIINENGFKISAQEMGGGVQNTLVLAILQAFEQTRKQGAILLIEEPEMFLHPQMQRALYRTLKEIGKTNQVIYTTHSPHFVALPDYNEVMLVRKSRRGTILTSSNLPLDKHRREKLIKEFDPERSELFFAQRLLLVEGDTEKLALPVYADRSCINLDLSGATIVEVGGKRNLIAFAEIAISFGIPTGIVYDSDSADFKNNKEEEELYNCQLDALSRVDGTVRVWRLKNNYEDCLRQAISESKYQKMCQKFSKTGKPTRARLIALEDDLPVPLPLSEVLEWLGGRLKNN